MALTILESLSESVQPATLPLFSLVQFRDDQYRSVDKIGIAFPNWGTKILTSRALFSPTDIMDFVFPIFHAKEPITFQLAQSVYTERTHPKTHPFVKRILQNKYLKNNTPSFRECHLVDINQEKNPLPFLHVSWNEQTQIYIRYQHIANISTTAGALLYQLTGCFLMRNALWRHLLL